MVAGNIADIGIAPQSAFGVAAALSVQRNYLTGGGVAHVPTISELNETSSGRLPNAAVLNSHKVEGSPAIYARPDSLGVWLFGVFGAVAHTGVADPWTHTYTLADTQPWMTIWKALGNLLYERFIDVKIGDAELVSEAGQPLILTSPLLGLKARYLGAAEPGGAVADTDAPFMHYDGVGALKLETVAVSTIERIAIRIGSGLSWAQGDSVEGSGVFEGKRAITIETRQTVTDLALYNRMHYGTANPAPGALPTNDVIELGGAPAGIDYKWLRAAGPPERSLAITATRLQVQSIAGLDPSPGGDPLKQTVTYKVFQPAGAVSGITAVLKNAVATH